MAYIPYPKGIGGLRHFYKQWTRNIPHNRLADFYGTSHGEWWRKTPRCLWSIFGVRLGLWALLID